MVLATWWGLANGTSIALAVVLAFLFGYSLTLWPVLRSGAGVPRGRSASPWPPTRSRS